MSKMKTHSMRWLVAPVLAVALIAVPSPAPSAAYRVPTVTEGIAEEFSYRLMRGVPGWRYRSDSYMDCSRGRISRTAWSCRVGWVYGYGCRRGRIRVEGSYISEGRKYYSSHAAWLPGC